VQFNISSQEDQINSQDEKGCFSSVLLSASCFLAQKMFSLKKNTMVVTNGRTHACV